MELLQKYKPSSEQEKIFKHKMLELFTKKGKKAFTRQNLEAHFTASAWIVDSSLQKVLLIHHKKLNKWLQPGGHADGEEDLESVARKEAAEETNLQKLEPLTNDIFDIDIHWIPEKKGLQKHEHYDVRFAYFCTNIENTQINAESTAYKWIDMTEINSLTDEISILRMVAKTKLLLNEL